MTKDDPLDEAEVRTFVEDWYGRLDRHVPVDELLPLLARDGLEMVFPEGDVNSQDDFVRWYSEGLEHYAAEQHLVSEILVSTSGSTADVVVRLEWRATIADPAPGEPARLVSPMRQRWSIRRDADGRPVIATYYCDELEASEE
jgi:SnoaL-like domain